MQKMYPPNKLGHHLACPNLLLGKYALSLSFLFLAVLVSAQLSVAFDIQPISCPGQNDAGIQALVTGGEAPYDYLWSNDSTVASLESLSPGLYHLKVTDALGDTISASIDIPPATNMMLFLTPIKPACLSTENGRIVAEVFGGSPPYSFNWNTGEVKPSLDSLAVGHYLLTVTDSHGCQQTSSLFLDAQSKLNVGALGTPASCMEVNDGLATASAQFGVQPYSYRWDNGGQSQVIDELAVGTYVVTVTDALGCVDTASAWVQTALSLKATGSALLCGPGPNSSMSIQAVGGTAPYAYQWSTGQASSYMENLTAGTYEVTVTDAKGCKMVETFDMASFDFSISVIPRNVLCYGDSTGSVVVQVSGGEPPYAFSWSNGDTTDVLNNLPAGTYAVTVMDANGCELGETVDLTEPPPLSLSMLKTDVNCNGEMSGSAMVIPAGGKPPYSYLWSNNGINDFIDHLVPGNYTVTVADANLCEQEISVEIIEALPLQVAISHFSVDCEATSGTLTAEVSGGTAPYHYAWSTGDTLSTTTNLQAGSYQLTVTDANACTFEVVDITLGGDSPFEIAFEITPISCSDDPIGAITAQVLGGFSPYTFSWSNGATSQSIENLSAGSYELTVTDANGCQQSAEATLSQTPALSAAITGKDIACFGQTNGQAEAVINSGTAPFFYQWSNGRSGSTIVNLAAGTYTLSVTDNVGCTDTTSILIQEPPILAVEAMATDISCSGAQDGSAAVTVSGGVAPYQFAWGNGATTAMINNLSVGSYGVIINDHNHCIAVASVNINEPPPLAISLIIEKIPCEGNADGLIRSTVSGGTSPYTYLWNNGDTSAVIDGLKGGLNYSLTVTDARGCQITADLFLEENPGLSLQLDSQDILCFGQNNGALNSQISGGTGPFFYNWNTGNTSASLVNLSVGGYQLTVTDIVGCSDTASAFIQEPLPLVVLTSSTDISCSGAQDGQASVDVSGGLAPYAFAWGNGDTLADINNLEAGSYGVIVSDANACIAAASINIAEPPSLSISIVLEQTPCEGNADGRIRATGSGGTPGYTFLWNTGDTSATIAGLTGGTYQVTLTDSSGCQISTAVDLTERPGVAVTLFPQNILCFGGANGSAQAAVEGGTGPFSYSWSNGATTSAISNLTVGTYALTLTDLAGCTATNAVTIVQPDSLELIINSNPITCFGDSNGKVSLNILGGVAPYQYLWSNDSTQQEINGLPGGLYEVTVTDANACQSSTQVAVDEPEALSNTFIIVEMPCEGSSTGVIEAEIAGGTAEYQFSWSNGGGKSGIGNVAAGHYFLTVTDGNGCQLVDSLNLLANPQPECVIIVLNDITTGADGVLEAIVSNGTAPYLFNWSNGDTTALIDNLSSGDYTLTVTDANGCMSSCSDTLMGLASLGSFVWIDLNRDGIQDEDEPGFGQVSISITKIDTIAPRFMATTQTDEFGFYQFDVPPGQYQLKFTLPEGYVLTKPNQGDDEERDSDIDPTTFLSDTITLTPRAVLFNLDAGCISECDRLTHPGLIAPSTTYLCGAGNDPGPILNAVSATGGSGALEYLWMKSLEETPFSSSQWEPIPDSNTPSYDPGVLYETTYFVRCARREKCSTYLESNVVKIEVGTEAVAKVVQPVKICEGDQVTFSAIETGPAAKIDWVFTGSVTPATISGENVSVRYSYFGTFNGTLTVQENGCTATRSFPVNVINNPILCTAGLSIQAEVIEEENKIVRLTWLMEHSEADLQYQLEYSRDGEHFETIANSIEPIEQSGQQLQFRLDTQAPKRGYNYYRVKVGDRSGNFMYSDIKEVVFLNDSALAMLYPNPVTDQLTIAFFETYDEPVRMELLSTQGHLLSSTDLPNGEQEIHLFLGDLTTGVYFLRIYYGEVAIKHLRIYKH
ncbi:MAG: SdrD B-like domain-containing protein [Saprospiraceae bacterium]